LGCFSVLGLEVSAGCVWIRHIKSQNVIERHRKSIASYNVEQSFLSRDSKFMGKVMEENRYDNHNHFER